MGARSLRIIFLTITFDPEPGAQHGLPLARWLQSRGHEVKVLTCFPQYPIGKIYPGYGTRLWQWETMDGVRVLRVPIYPSHDRSILRRMATYFSFMATALVIGAPLIGPADVVFLYEPPPTNGLVSLALKLFRGTPIVHHIADMWPETVIEAGVLERQWVKKAIETTIRAYCGLLYRHASHVSVLSPGFKRLLVGRGVPAEKVTVVYNWADEKNFGVVPRDEAFARELGLAGRFNVVYAGNLGPLQNIETLVRSAALLRDYPELQVVIVGTGPDRDAVIRLAKELNLINVRFVERQPYTAMAKLNALSDVLVVHLRDLAFLRATIPSKTQVAMACGRPVLIAVRGDAADLVERAGAGVACAPESPESMAEAILRLYRMSPDERAAMGARGRSYYERHLSLDASAGAMESLFLRAAGAPNAVADDSGSAPSVRANGASRVYV
jgi:glycosyltransferase involved in cell wall biosynthesis